jgi:hypothetical protein
MCEGWIIFEGHMSFICIVYCVLYKKKEVDFAPPLFSRYCLKTRVHDSKTNTLHAANPQLEQSFLDPETYTYPTTPL